MAATAIHEPPHLQLARLAREARAAGTSFDAFWTRAVRENKSVVMVTHTDPPAGAVRWPTDPYERKAWRNAILDTRENWRRAYEGEEPGEQERALIVLSGDFEALDTVASERAAGELPGAMDAQQGLLSVA